MGRSKVTDCRADEKTEQVCGWVGQTSEWEQEERWEWDIWSVSKGGHVWGDEGEKA